jgi:DNA segregation ATPase FtsK/SpoIIIE, S-DNA-T family
MGKKKATKKKEMNFFDSLIREDEDTQKSNYLWAILVFGLSLFIFITNKNPASTGILGHWVIAVYFTKLVGSGVDYFPLYLSLFGLSLLFSFSRWKTLLATTLMCFTNNILLLSLLTQKTISKITWPVPEIGGGWLGNICLFIFHKIIGVNGTWILISCIFLVSAIIFLNFSLRPPALLLINFLIKNIRFIKNSEFIESIDNDDHIIKRIIYFLFFKKSKTSPVIDDKPKGISYEDIKDIHEEKDQININDFELSEENIIDIETDSQELEIKEKQIKPKIKLTRKAQEYELPPISLLEKNVVKSVNIKSKKLLSQERAAHLEEALASFNVEAKVIDITIGPAVTRFELQPGVGVKISKITALTKDISLKLAASNLRIEAPIPGKALIGIEVPNPQTDTINLRNIIDKTDFLESPSKLSIALGLTITGEAVLMDLSKMPHILIAGATGSGKSVCINSIILSILMKATPEEVKFLMIDPKKVELSIYEGIPHLLAPVVTNPNKAAATLKQWALLEMDRRYEEFAQVSVKNIEGYNKYVENKLAENANAEKPVDENLKKLPYIVVIIDELADLMMVASQDVENTICRLAQMARATGIHLVIATQRPSVNVITGLIKANIPSRLSFFLQSQIDSRTIIDMPGAEKLLGKGDMLYSPVGAFKPQRLQGVFISESEAKKVVSFLKKQRTPDYLEEIVDIEPIKEAEQNTSNNSTDELFDEAKNIILNTRYASTSYLQRKLRIGYNRAARLMDELEESGLVVREHGEKKASTVVAPQEL